jgi:hypothetical protein
MNDLTRIAGYLSYPTLICGYCGKPIKRTASPTTADLASGYDHVATPSDWGEPDQIPRRWRHVVKVVKAKTTKSINRSQSHGNEKR